MSKPLEPFPIQLPDEQQPQTDAPPAYAPAPQPRRKGKKVVWVMVIIAAMLLLAAGAAAYWFLGRPKPAADQSAQTTQSSGSAQTPTPDNSVNSGSAQYVSNGQDLNLSFSYPSGWTVSPASGGNSDDMPITVTSPLVSLSGANDHAVTGKVIVSIRPAAAQLTELASGKASIAQDSVQFAYTKPTSVQHQYPYLTYIHLGGGNNTNAVFEEVIITGVTKFTKGQALFPESMGALDPIISAAFYQCATQACTGSGATPLSISDSIWQSTNVFEQTQAIFASLELH